MQKLKVVIKKLHQKAKELGIENDLFENQNDFYRTFSFTFHINKTDDFHPLSFGYLTIQQSQGLF